MRKNVSGQKISASLVAKADGSAVTTGTTTVYVTVDGGTQATTGAATHKGNGEWSYAPSQAETNGNHVAYTFVNTLAVGVTVNVYPVAYDPTDAVRLGISSLPNATAGAASGLAIVGSNMGTATSVTGAVGSVTGNVGGNVVGSVGSATTVNGLAAGVITAASIATDAITAAKVATDVIAEIWAGAPAGPTLNDQADAVWARAPGSIVAGTVAASPAPTTTTLTATVDVVPTVADQFKGRIVIFAADTTTAALRGQATDITASTAPGSGQAGLTFTALTTAPVTGDVFKIL